MSIATLRLDEKTKNEAERFAQKNGLSLSEYLRTIIEKAIVVEKYHEQNPQPSETQSSEKLPDEEMQAEYKRNLEYLLLETNALLRTIVKESSKFTTDEAVKLLNTSQAKTEKYMAYYKKHI